MRPLFTIHGGEYITASYLERKFKKNLRVWVPSIDDGIDLLLTSRNCRKTVSLQIKSSKSYELKTTVDASGWWQINADKLQKSNADFWAFVILPTGISKRKIYTPFFIVIQPKELLKRLKAIHGIEEVYNIYFTVKRKTAIESRGIDLKDISAMLANPEKSRDFSEFLDTWDGVLAALK